MISLKEYDKTELISGINKITPDHFLTGVCNIDDFSSQLTSQELKPAMNYKSKRMREYSTGRYLSKKILNGAVVECLSLAKLSSGAPAWPQNVKGSISHCDDLCVSVATISEKMLSVGIDIEKTGQLTPQDSRIFMSDSEFNVIMSLEPGKRDMMFTVAFSIREAIYKCLNPIYDKWINYEDARIDFIESSNDRVEVEVAGYKDLTGLECRYIIADPYVFALATLDKPLI